MTSVPIHADKKRSWWLQLNGLLLVGAITSSIYAWWSFALPVLNFDRLGRHTGHGYLTYSHVAGGSIMLFLGALNLYIGATRKHFKWHRLVGQTYLLGGAVGVMAAIVLTVGPAHKKDATVIFTNVGVSLITLSFAWLASAVLAYRAARNRRFDSHRDWMIRNYVLIWAFAFCRLGDLLPAVKEMGGGEAFIWLSWVGPLVLCEIGLQWKHGTKAVRGGA